MSGFGKITEAERDMTESGTWSNDHGTYHVWRVTIDADGKTIKTAVNRKVKDGESKDPTGEPAELKNGKWKVAAAQGVGGNTKGAAASKDFKADPAKLRAENARSALHAAVALVNHDKLPLDKLGEFTAKFYDFVERHAKVGE